MPSPAPLRYSLSVASPTRRLLRATLAVDAPAEGLTLRMPAWSPGSYMIREYARHVVEVRATDRRGRAVPVRRLSKDSWRVAASGAVRVAWLVYANELSVRTNHVDDAHAFVQPTATFLTPEGMEGRPLTLEVATPRGWDVATSLRRRGKAFTAEDAEALHDAPLLLGRLRRLPFRVRGVPHEIALDGAGNEDPRRLAKDLAAVVEQGARIFGGLPYDRYVVQAMLADVAGGGLEHREGFVVQVQRHAFRPQKAYDRVLALLAHEFFHAWNVRRIRPAGLLPYDLSRERYTRLLWQFEGVTSYYEVLLLRRAGLWSRARALEAFAERVAMLLALPGRRAMSLADASLTAWVKFYRPDENSGNAAVSYYLKGSLAGLALDLHLRAATGGRRSYDDVMRRLWRRHGGKDAPVPEDAMPRILAEVGGRGAARLHDRLVEGTGEIPWDGLLAPFGLRLDRTSAEGGWLGVETEEKGGRTHAKSVRADGPAAEAVAAGDEIVALDGLRVNGDGLAKRLAERRPGERVRLALLRGDRLLAAAVRLGRPPAEKVAILPAKGAGAREAALLRGWLGA